MQTIISFANGPKRYVDGLIKQEKSFKDVGFSGKYKAYTSFNEINSPTHTEVPYAFKAYAIKKAMEEQNNTGLLLWCDSVVYADKPLDNVFKYIKQHGYLFFDNIGFSIADFTKKTCLSKWQMQYSDAIAAPMIMATVMGFNLDDPIAQRFLKLYINAAKDGVSYLGDWETHRHDQSVASIIIYQNKLKITNAQDTFFAYKEHVGKLKIANTVCLWH